MEPVGGAAITRFIALPKRCAVKGAALLTESPGIAEIVFGAGAAEARFGFAVDKEEIITLAIPAGRGVVNALHGADVMALAFNVGEQVVLAHYAGVFLAVHGVEIGGVFGQVGMLLPIDIVIEGAAFFVALVSDGDAGGFAEGHGPIAVAGPAFRGDAYGQGSEFLIDTVADAKKITNRRFDAGMLFAVPVDTQGEQAGIEGRIVGDGAPDVGDQAGAIKLGDGQSVSRGDGSGVAVAGAPILVRGGGAHRLKRFQALESVKRVTGGGLDGAADYGQNDCRK